MKSQSEPASVSVTALDLRRAELSPDLQAMFDKCVAKFGFVPNVLQAYAHDNAKLAAFSAFYNELMLAPSGLSKLEREMIAVAVSAQNHCFYCLVAHGAAVRVISGEPPLADALAANHRMADLPARQRAMLDFAVKVATSSALIGEGDRAALRAQGFADRDIWDIAAVASFFSMSNRMASAVDMRPNAEYFAMGR